MLLPVNLEKISEHRFKIIVLKEIISLMEDKKKASDLPDFFYGPLENEIANSNFWRYSNLADQSDMESIRGEWHNQTEAAKLLGYTIENFLKSAGIPITIAVISVEPEVNTKLSLPVGPGHKLYPNSLVAGGSQGISQRGRFVMYLFMVPTSDDFRPEDVNPVTVSRIIGNIIRHEYIHANQMEKRRRKQKVSRQVAKDRFEEEGEIVPDNAPRKDYLSSKIEIDAYAHEIAEQILQMYGKERSLDILRGASDLSELELSDQFIEYLEGVAGAGSLRRLKSKMYSHIQNLTARGIYEILKHSNIEEAYRKGTVKSLYLDKPTSHGGWPEGPSRSYTSNEPVNKQISGWLKDMSMIDENIIEKVRRVVESGVY